MGKSCLWQIEALNKSQIFTLYAFSKNYVLNFYSAK